MRLTHSYSSLKLFENCPLRYYRQRITKEVEDTDTEYTKYGERVHVLLEARLKEGKIAEDIAKYEPLCQAVEELAKHGQLFVEKELVLTENLTPTDWWAPDAWLRSRLDVLILIDDMAIVMDWKTGKRNPDQFQMELFAAQVFKHFPEVKQVKTSLVWLKPLEMDVERYDRQEMNKLWAGVMRRIRRVYDAYENANWPARPSGLCRYCPCRYDCDYAAV